MTRKQEVDALHDKLGETLNKFALENNLAYIEGRGKYSDTAVTFSVEFASINKSGVVESQKALAFDSYKGYHDGLEKANLGDKFIAGGHTYNISGYAYRSRKYPILAIQRGNGREYKFTVRAVVNGLGR